MPMRNKVLASNVKSLIAYHRTSLSAVADSTGIPLIVLCAVINQQSQHATLEIVEKLAWHFKLKPFQILIPNLPMSLTGKGKVMFIRIGRGAHWLHEPKKHLIH